MASRYPLNLPADLKHRAATLARKQGISLNQFFLWSISEKVSELSASLDDPRFPFITYRRGASGIPTPVIAGSGVRVETVAVAHAQWGETAEDLAADYELPRAAVEEALAFYQAHRDEIDALIRLEQEIEARHGET